MPRILQGDERVRKSRIAGGNMIRRARVAPGAAGPQISDRRWKPLQYLFVPASVFCVSVFEGAVYLRPCRVTVSANEQVGGGTGQRMEHRVVRRTDGAAQIGMRGPPRTGFRQAAGCCYQVVRVHVQAVLIPDRGIHTPENGPVKVAEPRWRPEPGTARRSRSVGSGRSSSPASRTGCGCSNRWRSWGRVGPVSFVARFDLPSACPPASQTLNRNSITSPSRTR